LPDERFGAQGLTSEAGRHAQSPPEEKCQDQHDGKYNADCYGRSASAHFMFQVGAHIRGRVRGP
jgi:hypothetical protein